jgi:hypothetical protein
LLFWAAVPALAAALALFLLRDRDRLLSVDAQLGAKAAVIRGDSDAIHQRT